MFMSFGLNGLVVFIILVSLVWCRYRDGFVFEVGSRPDSRGTFFCLAKRKCPKKKPPRRRFFPALLRFERGFPKGLPSPYVKRDASLHRP
jgi:hypothetical protein